jgi:MFS family permease
MAGGNEHWDDSKLLARAILQDRASRRKVIGRMLMFALLMLAAGLWLINGWLAESVWRFLLWWAGCAGVVLLVILFALYDSLAVIREERQKRR